MGLHVKDIKSYEKTNTTLIETDLIHQAREMAEVDKQSRLSNDCGHFGVMMLSQQPHLFG